MWLGYCMHQSDTSTVSAPVATSMRETRALVRQFAVATFGQLSL